MRASRFSARTLRGLIVAVAAWGTQLSAQVTTVVVVRHAEKAAAPADDPPLSAAGLARAESLSVSLAAFPVDAIVVTATERTRQTAAPTARRAGLTPITAYNAGSVAVRSDSIAALIRRGYGGKTVLVVGHSNTVPSIIKALGGPAMADLCDAEYDSIFVLQLPTTGAPRLLRATFGVADGAAGAACATMKGLTPSGER